jgi:hypothetical protein
VSRLKLEQVRKEDLGPLGEQLGEPFEVVSRFMKSTTGILNGGFLFGDNAACVLKEITITTAELPAIISLGPGFPGRPAIMIPVKVSGSVGVGCPAWESISVGGQDGVENAVKVYDFPGLVPGVRTTMTLLIVAG